MKTVLWKPFQRWTGSLYSSYRSSNRGTTHDKSKVELTSQDPIVDDVHVDGSETSGGYRLNSMDFGKPSPGAQEEERYPSRLEKTLGRLPSTSYTKNYSRDFKKASQSSDEVLHSKLEISKETSIQVSSMSNHDDRDDDLAELPSNGRPGRNSKPSHYNKTANVDWD
jgi:hypothetical protein